MTYSLLKIFKVKQWRIYVFFFTTCFLVLHTITLIFEYTINKIDSDIIEKVNNRLIYVKNNDGLDKYMKLSQITNVEKVYYDNQEVQVIFEETSVAVNTEKPTSDVKIISGKSMDKDLNSILVPNYIVDKGIKIDMGGLLDKQISIYHNGVSYELKIIGLYDNIDNKNVFYVSNDFFNNNFYTPNEYIVLINKQMNVKNVSEEVRKCNCTTSIDDSYKNELQTYQTIKKILILFNVICLSVILVILLIIMMTNIIEKKYSIALLKSQGFSNLMISNVILIMFGSIQVFSYCLSFVSIHVLNLLLYKLLGIKILLYSLIIKNFIVTFILFFSTTIIVLRKIKNINIINLLK